MPSSQNHSSNFDLTRVLAETFVGDVEFHRELASTNDLALQRHASDNLPLLVIAEHQTAGRGRGENRWWSADGALMLSLLLDVDLPMQRWPQVSLTVGLAVCEVLGGLVSDRQIGLKWPNDVYLDQRKVCGILVEVPTEAQRRIVLGIGLNVNNSFSNAPEELQQTATSMSDAAGRSFEMTEVLVRLLNQLEGELELLIAGSLDFPQRWQSLCMLQGCEVELATGGQTVTGICQGIDPQGAIVIETPEGRQKFFGGSVLRRGSSEAP